MIPPEYQDNGGKIQCRSDHMMANYFGSYKGIVIIKNTIDNHIQNVFSHYFVV